MGAMTDSASYPPGTIVCRVIRGKKRYYHQWREDGRTKSRYLKADEILPLRERIEQRKALEAKKKASPAALARPDAHPVRFACGVLMGRRLDELSDSTRRFGSRRILATLVDHLKREDPPPHDLLLVEGFPGTGKSCLLRQTLAALTADERARAAYLSLPCDATLPALLNDLHTLVDLGVTRVLIDGLDRPVALVAAVPVLEDTFGALGLRLVATATTPHALHLSSRTRRISTTALSFEDAQSLDRNVSLEAYLQTGGPTLAQLDSRTRADLASLNAHALLDLLSAARHERRLGSARLTHDIQKLTRRLIEIIPPQPDETACSRLRQLDVVSLSEGEAFLIVPGIRHALSQGLLRRLLSEDVAAHLGAAERKLVEEQILRLVADRTLADLVLWETQRRRANDTTDVFRIRFPSGGFDVVVADREELTCELFEVRLASERHPQQLVNLENADMLDTVEHRYGTIVQRTLVYLGRNAWHASGIACRNAAQWLTDDKSAAI